MRVFVLTAITLSTIGCGSNYESDKSVIAPDLVQFVEEFNEITSKYPKYIVHYIMWSNLEENILGKCEWHSNKKRIVRISNELKPSLIHDIQYVRHTVYHELIHCALDMHGHYKGNYPSIMSEYADPWTVERPKYYLRDFLKKLSLYGANFANWK